ncbi:MAG: hypothetical protein ACREMO_03125, partial [Gemmatimonadales bacterium]
MSRGGAAVGRPEIEPVEGTVFLGDVVIIGGGCYGTFYARQLERARARGKASYRRVLIVDRDPDCQAGRELDQGQDRLLVVSEWGAFLDQYLESSDARPEPPGPPAEDVIVPSPLMPHLMYEWLLRRARARWPSRAVETRPIPSGPGTPYDTTAPDATRYVSFADWLCPTHCIEPAVCPVIRAPRTWEMSDALVGLTARLNQDQVTAGPVLLVCRHQVFAVGTFSVAAVRAGDALVTAAGTAGTPVDVLVGTVSACHGALNLLHLG